MLAGLSLAAPSLQAQLPGRPLSSVTDRSAEDLEGGLRYHRIVGREPGADPWSAHMLEVDLTRHGIDIVLALDQIVGQEAPSSMVRRFGAAAAVNGGFSVSNDPWNIIHGDPNGFLVVDGVVLSEPVASRPAIGFCGAPGAQEVRIVTPRLAVGLLPRLAPGGAVGLNRRRESGDLVVYTPEWNSTTLTDPGGIEWVVRRGTVVSVGEGGSTPIPRDGFVVSAEGESATALSGLSPGDALELVRGVTGESGSPVDLSGCDFTAAGPVVARGGQVVRDHPPESYREGFVVERHPRTAVGLSADGRTLLLYVIDGRQPERSVGATLEELAGLLISEGASTVYNLDGGGSSAMVVAGRGVLNAPSDGRERRRSDVLLVRPARPRHGG
jgi:hypothetical protein